MGVALGLVASAVSHAAAHDATTTLTNAIVDVDEFLSPGPGDEASNGIQVFLSSPRHADSGTKGECEPGYQENINGRRWNIFAANRDDTNNMHRRGYTVRVSKNIKDNGFLANSENSRNWGSDIHIITHTDGFRRCPNGGDFSSFLWEDDIGARDDRRLANELRELVEPQIPGPYNQQQRTDLGELDTNARGG